MVQAILKELLEIIGLIIGMIMALLLIWVVGNGMTKAYHFLMTPFARIMKKIVQRK